MSVPAYEPTRAIGNGATSVYPFTFPVQDEDHLVVVVQDTDGNDSTLSLGDSADYTVELEADGTGSITLVDGALTTDYLITISRETPRLQTASFRGQRSFFGAAHDDAFDKAMMIIQEMQDALDRSLQLSGHEDPADYDLTIPLEEDRAEKFLYFDADGNLTAVSILGAGELATSAFGESFIAAASGSAALTLLGVSSFVQTILNDATGDDVLTTLGLSAFVLEIIDDATAGDVLTTLGLTDFIQELADDEDADTALSTLGLSTFVKTLVDAADEAEFRDLIGAAAGTEGGGDPAHTFQARLSLTSGVAITTADVTGAGTIYLVPFKGNQIALYDGAAWVTHTLSAQLSLALTATSGKPYDVFVYDNAGTPTLETLVWTNDTTRGTALTTQDGVLAKTGALTRRYVGTFYASGTDTTEDSRAKRYLWNYYNRARRLMLVTEATNSWTYDGGSGIRIARAASTNKLQFVVGVTEDEVTARLVVASKLTDDEAGVVGIGLDSVAAFASGSLFGPGQINSTSSDLEIALGASLTTYGIAPGFHYLAWLENADNGTATFYGDTPASLAGQSGISGEIFA